MYQFNVMIYCILLGLIITTGKLSYILGFLGFGALLLLIYPVFKKIKKDILKNQIKNFPDYEALNVNKALWWEFEQLPKITRVQAKKMVWIRKHNGKYLSKEDFLNKNNIKNKEEIIKLIFV